MTMLLNALQQTATQQFADKKAEVEATVLGEIAEIHQANAEAQELVYAERTAAYTKFRTDLHDTAEMSDGFMTCMEYTGCHLRLDFTGNDVTNTLLVEYNPTDKIMVAELDGKNILGIKRGLSPSAAMARINEVVGYWDILVDGDAIDKAIREQAGVGPRKVEPTTQPAESDDLDLGKAA